MIVEGGSVRVTLFTGMNTGPRAGRGTLTQRLAAAHRDHHLEPCHDVDIDVLYPISVYADIGIMKRRYRRFD